MSRVYVLGSGFSVKAGAPLSRAVLPLLFREDRQTSDILNLKNYLADFLFHGRTDWYTDTGLEEVLSRLDLIRHYRPYPGIDYSKVSHYEELLLSEFTKLLAPENIRPKQPVYRYFLDLVTDLDTVITFNYDLIVENLLHAAGRSFSYCLNHAGNSGPQAKKALNLLKLHGSINLYYCPVCGGVFPFAHQHLRHFIIAPTQFKSFSLPSLRHLWYMALNALSRARDIFFIGYSLPEADILSFQLFDFAQRLSGKKQKVCLINGPRLNPGRFHQIYGRKLYNTASYFEEWIDAQNRKKGERRTTE